MGADSARNWFSGARFFARGVVFDHEMAGFQGRANDGPQLVTSFGFASAFTSAWNFAASPRFGQPSGRARLFVAGRVFRGFQKRVASRLLYDIVRLELCVNFFTTLLRLPNAGHPPGSDAGTTRGGTGVPDADVPGEGVAGSAEAHAEKREGVGAAVEMKEEEEEGVEQECQKR